MNAHDFSCKTCGAEMENAKFCEYCGAAFQAGEAPAHLPDPLEKDTVFTIEDVFKIRGQGQVMVGKASNQPISIGETFTLADSAGNPIETVTIKRIEILKKTAPTTAEVGENAGLLIETELKLKRGMILLK